jgi:hypothetical protein
LYVGQRCWLQDEGCINLLSNKETNISVNRFAKPYSQSCQYIPPAVMKYHDVPGILGEHWHLAIL